MRSLLTFLLLAFNWLLDSRSPYTTLGIRRILVLTDLSFSKVLIPHLAQPFSIRLHEVYGSITGSQKTGNLLGTVMMIPHRLTFTEQVTSMTYGSVGNVELWKQNPGQIVKRI
jgi:hypothetical protein